MKIINFLIIFLLFALPPVFAQDESQGINITDVKGLKQGVWKKKYDDGKVRYEGNFVDDKPTGTFRYFYPVSGKLSTLAEYSDNGNKMKAIMYHENGKTKATGKYLKEKKDGEWKYFNDEGLLVSEEFYNVGKKIGIWKTFYGNGIVASEQTWKDDKENGPWKEYFSNGKLKVEGKYINGLIEGTVSYYNSEGILSIKGDYKNGKREGTWNFYDEKGKIKETKKFVKDRLIEPKEDKKQ